MKLCYDIDMIVNFFKMSVEREIRARQDQNNNSSFVMDRYDFLSNLLDPCSWWIVIERPINEFRRARQSQSWSFYAVLCIIERSESWINDCRLVINCCSVLHTEPVCLVQKWRSLNLLIKYYTYDKFKYFSHHFVLRSWDTLVRKCVARLRALLKNGCIIGESTTTAGG